MDDDENEIPLKVIASFSASRFALPYIPLIVLHSLVTCLLVQGLNKISPFLPFVCVDAVLDLFYGGHLVLSSHPISPLVQVPRGVCVVQ